MDSNPPSPTRSRRCFPKLADALAYSDSESERTDSAEPAPEQDLVVEHLPGRSASLEFSLGQPSSGSAELLQGRSSMERSPGRADSLDPALGRDASMDLSFGQGASMYFSSKRDTTTEMSPCRATSLQLASGRDTIPEMSPRRATSLHLSSGREANPDMSPGRTSFHMSAGRAASMNIPIGRDTSPHLYLSSGSATPLCITTGEASSFDLSSGQAASPSISLRRSKLLNLSPRRNSSHQLAEPASSFDLSPGQAEYFGKSPGRSKSLNLSPGGATSSEVSPGKTESEILTRRTVSNNTLSEDGPQHKRSVSRTPSDVGKIHIHVPTTQRLDHGISDIGSPEPALPFSFGAMPLPPIKGSLHQKECRKDMKTTEEKRRRVEKENELNEIKDILLNQKETFDKKRVAGNDLRILSKHRNMESIPLTKKENTKVAVYKKIMPKHAPVPPKEPKPSSQPKSHIIVRETKASKLRQIVKNEQQVVTRKVLPPVQSPINPPARPIVVYLAPGRSLVSPLPSSRSSSESPPPTPKEDGPPRPHFVPSLDLSFLLSPEDYPSGAPIPPPVFAVRETKASRLRRQKKEEEEKKAKSQRKTDKSRDVEWEHSLESIQRTRTPIQTFKPSPPKAYKKPVPVIVKETKASKLRFKLPEIKKGNRK